MVLIKAALALALAVASILLIVVGCAIAVAAPNGFPGVLLAVLGVCGLGAAVEYLDKKTRAEEATDGDR